LEFQRGRFDLALNRPMQLNPEHPDMLHAKPVAGKSDTVSIGRELNAVEATSRLEARVTRLLRFGLYAAEEVAESLMQSAHRRLRRRKVKSLKVAVGCALALKPSGLLSVAYRSLFRSPSVTALRQTSVVKSPAP